MSESAPRRRLTASDLWTIPRVGTPALARDGSFAVVSVTTYTGDAGERREQLFRIPTSAPREARALTAPDVSSGEPAVSPDGRNLAFVRTPPGSDQAQAYVMPLDGGEARRVTDLPLGVSDPRWLPDGKHFIVLSPLYRSALTVEGTRRLRDERKKLGTLPRVTEDRVFRYWDRWLTEGEVHHLFLVNIATGEARDLLPSSERWFDLMDPAGEYDISPTGDEVAFSADASLPPHSPMRYAIYTVPIAGGEPTCLTPNNPADDKRPRYSPDGRFLVYGAKHDLDNYADKVRLVRVERATSKHTILTETWDSSPSAWEFAGKATLFLDTEAEGRSCIYRMNVAEEKAPELVARGGTLHGICPTADGFVYAQYHTFTHPPEVARFPAAGGPIETLSTFTDTVLEAFTLGHTEEVTFPGAGGDPVHMHVFFPPGYEPGKKYPLVQNIHGGPYGMHADCWHWRWNVQTLGAPGYVLAMVNFHGSSSYGQKFSDAILGDWGGKAAEDILLATDLLVERGIADPARMAIAGGSFGGYMVCWLATRTSRFACAIAHAAVFNLTTLAASDITLGTDREIGGKPWDTPAAREAIDRHNPAAFTSAYRTPMLVLHGDKDYRVPVEHGIELYGILKAKGVPARLVHYSDENHWILKRNNSIHWYGEFHGWLARYLDSARSPG